MRVALQENAGDPEVVFIFEMRSFFRNEKGQVFFGDEKKTRKEATVASRGFGFTYGGMVAAHKGSQFSERRWIIGPVSSCRLNRQTLTREIWEDKKSKGSDGNVDRIRVGIQQHRSDQQFHKSSVF